MTNRITKTLNGYALTSLPLQAELKDLVVNLRWAENEEPDAVAFLARMVRNTEAALAARLLVECN